MSWLEIVLGIICVLIWLYNRVINDKLQDLNRQQDVSMVYALQQEHRLSDVLSENRMMVSQLAALRNAVKDTEPENMKTYLNIFLNGYAAGAANAKKEHNPWCSFRSSNEWAIWQEGWEYGTKLRIQKERVKICKMNYKRLKSRYENLGDLCASAGAAIMKYDDRGN